MAKKSEGTIKAKTIFEHLSGIKEKKIPWESLSEVDKKSFSPFKINRFLSMNIELLPIVDLLQKYTVNKNVTPREVYKLYLDILPKKKSFDKYIKGPTESKYNTELLKYLSNWYKVSYREIEDYLELLPTDEVTSILKKYGLTEKQIKGLMK